MILIIFILEILILGYIDFKIYRTHYTPIIVLSVPFFVLLIINLLWGTRIGMVSFYLPALWIWIVGVFIFWLSGLFLSIAFLKKVKFIKEPLKDIKPGTTTFFQVLSIVLLILMYLKLASSLTKYNINSEEFSDSLSGGIPAHANILIRLPVVFFILTSSFSKKNILNWIIVLFWLIFAFLYNVKGWIFITIIAGVIGRIVYSDDKISFKKVLLILSCALLVFYISYSISFDSLAPLSFIIDHFIFYANSGILGMSEQIRLNKDIGSSLEFLFEPIFNVYYKIAGHQLKDIVSNIDSLITEDSSSNVKTFFGSIYIYGGLAGGILTSFLWGSVCYLFLILNLIKKNPIILITYLMLLGALCLGWFDMYFNALSYYEIVIAGLLLTFSFPNTFNTGKLKINQ